MMNIMFGVKLLVISGNLLWIAIEYSHFHYSNMEVYNTLKTGKMSIALDNVQTLLGKLDTYNNCIIVNKTNINSYTKEFVYLFGGLSDDAIEQLERMNDISNCLQNPYTVLDAVEKSAWAGIGIDNNFTENENDENNENNENENENEKSLITQDNNYQLTIIPQFKDLGLTENNNFDITTYNNGIQQIQYEFAQSCSFMEGIKYLEELADQKNNNLARKILNNEDFEIYIKEMELNKNKLNSENNQAVNIRIKPSFYQQATIIAGTIYELFVNKPSHTHLFDIINKVRDTINGYSRNMRNQYNFYNDLFYDTRIELEQITTKSTVAWKRASWLIINTGILGLQISELIIDNIIPSVLYYTKPLVINSVKPLVVGSVSTITNIDTDVINSLVDELEKITL